MYYYIKEREQESDLKKTAGFKARDDSEVIFERAGMKSINIVSNSVERQKGTVFSKILTHIRVKKNWQNKLKGLKAGDILFVQFPVVDHSLFMYKVFRKLVKRNVDVILLIHDLELLRWSLRSDSSKKTKFRLQREETSILDCATKVIVHNNKMRDYLSELGIKKDKMVNLEIFDYLHDNFDVSEKQKSYSKNGPVVIAGNLREYKAGYAYHLPDNYPFNLYGIDYTGTVNKKIRYFGSFLPDELLNVLEGGYGLVWDGNQIDTCSGTYGSYLKINNPHKTSLYLSIGLPVIIWSQAALADFVKKNNCGFVIDSIEDIKQKVSELSEDDYSTMLDNARKISQKLTAGYYTNRAIARCLK